jgi:hypothetical protein
MKQPWSPAFATRTINEIGSSLKLTISYTAHAKQRMLERDLVIGDVRYVLKRGFVHEDPEQSTQVGLYKYKIESRTPNSNNRTVRLIIIPDNINFWVKIVSIMWSDET